MNLMESLLAERFLEFRQGDAKIFRRKMQQGNGCIPVRSAWPPCLRLILFHVKYVIKPITLGESTAHSAPRRFVICLEEFSRCVTGLLTWGIIRRPCPTTGQGLFAEIVKGRGILPLPDEDVEPRRLDRGFMGETLRSV